MTWRVELGDSREQLRALDDASVDAVVTDPPYELGFMGKKWDASGIAYDVGLWREVLRVLKPGGYLLAFGATRTFHRMVCAVEDAGLEVRDTITWIRGGQSMPKSLDVAKALDKAAGIWRGRAGKVVSGNGSMSGGNYERTPKGDPVTPEAVNWSGWGTALKPVQEPILVARKPLDGTVAANVLAHGVGGLNIDGCRVAHATEADFAKHAAGVAAIKARGGSMAGSWANASDLSGANDVSRAGRWPPNAVFSHLPECGNTCAESCAVAELNGQSEDVSRFFPAFRYQAKPARAERDKGLSRFPTCDAGAAMNTRCAKCGRLRLGHESSRCACDAHVPAEQTSRAGVKNNHPTVKPIELMRWLVRLVTPPGGVVLDPFTGSGTTGCAAILERCSFVGVELSEEYRAIACARIEAAEAGRPCEQLDLFGGW